MANQDTIYTHCNSEEEIIHRLRQLVTTPANVENASNFLFDYLVEDIVLGLVFEVHQTNRVGSMAVMTEEEGKLFAIVDNTETDIFGQPHIKKAQECCCPSCNRPLSASRFAPHLEKCLGMGRNSSRIASRRIANNCKENAYGTISDDDDEDWVSGQEKSKISKKVDGKKKKDKNAFKKSKAPKPLPEKNQTTKVSEESNVIIKFENLSETK